MFKSRARSKKSRIKQAEIKLVMELIRPINFEIKNKLIKLLSNETNSNFKKLQLTRLLKS